MDDTDGPSDQPDGDRVAVRPEADLAVAVDPRVESRPVSNGPSAGRQQRLLGREVLANGAGTGPDSAGVVLLVPPVDPCVELSERVDVGDGDQVVAAAPADLALDSALFVGAADTGLAVRLRALPARTIETLAGDPERYFRTDSSGRLLPLAKFAESLTTRL